MRLRFYYGIFWLVGVLASYSHAQGILEEVATMMKTVIDNQKQLFSKFEETKGDIGRLESKMENETQKEEETKDAIERLERKMENEAQKEEERKGVVKRIESQIKTLTQKEEGTENLTQKKLADFLKQKEAEKRNIIAGNCKELLDEGMIHSGVYTITLEGFCDGVDVYCDQETDGGGWTVFLQRKRKCHQVNFARTFEEYAAGFGDPNGEIWIGNRVLHSMTADENFTLRVDAKKPEGESRTGIWENFRVGSSATKFTLSVGNYSERSTLGDALSNRDNHWSWANEKRFSAYDQDNDESSSTHCSKTRGKGGWWYSGCYGANPTAPFGGHDDYTKANWQFWETTGAAFYTAISEIQFKIRPQRK